MNGLKRTVFILGIFLLFLFFPRIALAQDAIVTCHTSTLVSVSDCSLVGGQCLAYIDGYNCICSFSASCGRPANICCTPDKFERGECPVTWGYEHSPYCVGASISCYGTGSGRYCITNNTCSWLFTNCSAGDRCSPCNNASGPEKVCAGICSDSGCTTGGWYKTCCQVQGAIASGSRLSGVQGTCVGSGGCTGSNVTTVRWGNFGSPAPTCSTNLCLQWFDDYSWVVSDCSAPTSAPGGPPPTETPITPQPPSKAWMYLDVEGTSHVVGSQVKVKACQKPGCCWCGSFYYDPLEATADQGPRTGKVCDLTGFNSDPHCNSCDILPVGEDKTNTGQDKYCYWDTTGWPAGYYRIFSSTGGHSNQTNITCGGQTGLNCNDGYASAWDFVTLVNPPAPPAKTCSVSLNASQFTVGQAVTITARGTGNSNPGSEMVRLWLEQWSSGTKGDAVVPTPQGTDQIHTSPDGRKFYRLGTCTSSNGNQCEFSASVSNLPQGSYIVHCDLPQLPYPPLCSGNPFCTYEGL
ncbi:hypothetical protein KKA69_02775, partial [Patescibacteria group bacterium]|nr:hypothetical protein [Patescibacteria group bacterium]